MARVAAELGISHQCAHRWVARYRRGGLEDLQDRSSRSYASAMSADPRRERAVLAPRAEHRRGQDWIGAELGMPARTVARVLRRHHVPCLRHCDPMTGQVVHASKTTAVSSPRWLRPAGGEVSPPPAGRSPHPPQPPAKMFFPFGVPSPVGPSHPVPETHSLRSKPTLSQAPGGAFCPRVTSFRAPFGAE